MRIMLVTVLFFFTGCVTPGGFGKYVNKSLQGFVYTKIKVPFSTDLNNTPVGETGSDGKIVRIREPVSGQGIYIQYNSNAIGDIALKNGLKKVYFADLEIFNLFGIWSYEKICIYGEK